MLLVVIYLLLLLLLWLWLLLMLFLLIVVVIVVVVAVVVVIVVVGVVVVWLFVVLCFMASLIVNKPCFSATLDPDGTAQLASGSFSSLSCEASTDDGSIQTTTTITTTIMSLT